MRGEAVRRFFFLFLPGFSRKGQRASCLSCQTIYLLFRPSQCGKRSDSLGRGYLGHLGWHAISVGPPNWRAGPGGAERVCAAVFSRDHEATFWCRTGVVRVCLTARWGCPEEKTKGVRR